MWFASLLSPVCSANWFLPLSPLLAFTGELRSGSPLPWCEQRDSQLQQPDSIPGEAVSSGPSCRAPRGPWQGQPLQGVLYTCGIKLNGTKPLIQDVYSDTSLIAGAGGRKEDVWYRWKGL